MVDRDAIDWLAGAPGSLVGIRTPNGEGCRVLSSDATSCLAQALARGRVIVRQCVALGAVLAGCAVWWLSPLDEPEPFVGWVLLVGGVVLLVDLGLGGFEHARATAHADELILAGFTRLSGRTPIERAVAHRLCWVQRPRSRHRLANDLRRRLRLADGSLHPSRGYMRATVLRPLAAYERRALLDEYPLVSCLADRVERAPVDPRALVLLWSVVSATSSYSATSAREAGEELGRRLHGACVLIERVEHRETAAATASAPMPSKAQPA